MTAWKNNPVKVGKINQPQSTKILIRIVYKQT